MKGLLSVLPRLLLLYIVMLAVTSPVRAATTFPAHLSGYRVDGTVQSVGPDGVVVNTADGVVTVPVKMANFKVAGKRVEPAALTAGSAVEVDYKGVNGTVLGLDGRLVSFQPKGAKAPLSLPLTFVAHTKVYVYTGKGDIVRVPIDQAISMQATQGTVVLGTEVPESYGSAYERSPWTIGGGIYWGTPWGWGPGWYGGRRWGGGIYWGR